MKPLYTIGIILACVSLTLQVFAQEPSTADTTRLFVITKSSTRFFSDMGNMSSVIEMIPAKTKVRIFEENGDYFAAWYNGNDGYILRKDVDFEPETLKYLEKMWAAKEPVPDDKTVTNDEAKSADARRNYLVRKYGNELGPKIFNRAIWKGMKKEMVWDSWGKPRRMYKDISGWEIKERWIYPVAELVFINGVLRDWVRYK